MSVKGRSRIAIASNLESPVHDEVMFVESHVHAVEL